MSRRVVTVQLQASGDGAKLDTYFDKLVKYIPADVIGAWIATSGLIQSAPNVPTATLLWIGFAFGVVFTAVWTWRQTSEPGKPTATTQIAIATIAFGVWVYSLGGPFATLDMYRPLYGSLVLIAFTLIIGLINPHEG